MLSFAIALLACLPQPQEREPVVVPPLEPVPVVVRIVNGVNGDPVVDLQLKLIGPEGSDLGEEVVTDTKGVFVARAGFEKGKILIVSQENRTSEGGRRWGAIRELYWYGRDQTIVAWPMMRYEIDARLPAGVPSSEMPMELRIVTGSTWLAQSYLAGGKSGRWAGSLSARLRPPSRIGALPWARFQSNLFGPGLTSQQRTKERESWDGIDLLDTRGLWASHIDLPEDGEPLVFELQRTATLKCDIIAPNHSFDREFNIRSNRKVKREASVTLRFLEGEFDQETVMPRKLVVEVGEKLDVRWLPPGRWEVEIVSKHFLTTTQEINLVAGENLLSPIVLGDPIALGSIGVILRDHDGDIGGGSGPVAVQAGVCLSTESGFTKRTVSSPFSYRDPGVDLHRGWEWGDAAFGCRLNGTEGEQVRWSNIKDLPDHTYQVYAGSPTHYAVPRVATARLGERVEITLHPIDSDAGYWVRFPNGTPEQFRFLRTQALDVKGEVVFRVLGGQECFVSGPLESGDEPTWCVWGNGFKRVYLSREDFARDKGRYLATVELKQGWAVRVEFVDKQGLPVMGVQAEFEGVTYHSDKAGVMYLESDQIDAEGELQYKGPKGGDYLHQRISDFGPNSDCWRIELAL